MKKIIIPLVLLSIIFAGCSTTKTIVSQACTEEAKVCPDGSAVGRTQPNCEFAACPTETGSTIGSDTPQACTEEAKLCPDGSAVGRTQPNCEFAPCPSEIGSTTGSATPQACTEEAKLCPDGSAVGRSGPNCEFAPCPGEDRSTCSCPEGYKQEGESCNPLCFYSTPKCLMPSRQCQ